jgi:hypothetical protein
MRTFLPVVDCGEIGLRATTEFRNWSRHRSAISSKRPFKIPKRLKSKPDLRCAGFERLTCGRSRLMLTQRICFYEAAKSLIPSQRCSATPRERSLDSAKFTLTQTQAPAAKERAEAGTPQARGEAMQG